ncbi:uncharacterized protein B0T15DRAFT_560036 [Chaetomium strumarium]|uniref:Transposase Tc1-like domain-containing protein n=1 Tax=Chaetomium strumarium TaxID=1170767 RepID=A0AAJ0GNG7_9PEZI|nr:hypothetical protein B0T15DRAFT_560036 [Chaetomium strumarium]
MGFQHHRTPKNRIVGTINYFRQNGLLGQGRLFTKESVFQHHGVSHTTSHRILQRIAEHPESRTFHNTHAETPGRKKLLDNEALKQTERYIKQGGFEGRTLPWKAIPAAAGLDIDVSACTVHRALRELNFHKCIACEREYRSIRRKENRLEYSSMMLERYLEPKDWYHVRFSNESHFGWVPRSKIWVLRRP